MNDEMLDFFFFKQKTAYEMRISDWSSDVCSSDLAIRFAGGDAVARDRSRLLFGPVIACDRHGRTARRHGRPADLRRTGIPQHHAETAGEKRHDTGQYPA